MGPGPWVSAHFRPPLAFHISTDWHCGTDAVEHLDLFKGGPNRQLSFFGRLPGVAADVTAVVRDLSGLAYRPGPGMRVGDRTIPSVLAQSRDDRAVVIDVFGGYQLHQGNQLELAVVPVRGGAVVVAVQAGTGIFAEFSTAARDLLRSVRFL